MKMQFSVPRFILTRQLIFSMGVIFQNVETLNTKITNLNASSIYKIYKYVSCVIMCHILFHRYDTHIVCDR